MKNKYGNLKCENCGSYHLKMSISYDGCSWEAEKGNGYDFIVTMDCKDCGRTYPICRTNKEHAISDLITKNN